MKKLSSLPWDSINAERFVPLEKQLQWDQLPNKLFVNNLCRHVRKLTQTTGWLNDPLHQRSHFDLSILNLLAFLPEGISRLQDSLINSFPPSFNETIFNHREFQTKISRLCDMIRESRFQVSSLERKLNSLSSMGIPPITIEKIKTQRNQQKESINSYNEDRVLRTTPENLARVCDEICMVMDKMQTENFVSTLQNAMNLRDCLEMVCKDYLTKTNILMDIERLQSLTDLNFYDMYSCRFECVEVPPPVHPIHYCLACQGSTNHEGNLCFYHSVLKADISFKAMQSFGRVQRIQGSHKPSILKTSKQFQIMKRHLQVMYKSRHHERELIVHIIIPGIAENRPLVSIGDSVRFRFGSVEVIGSVREIQTKTERVMIFIPIPYLPNQSCEQVMNALEYPKNRDEYYKLISHFGPNYRFDVRFGLFASRAHDIFKTTAHTAIANSMDQVLRVVAPTPILENIVKKSERRPHTGISNWAHPNLNHEQKDAVFDIVRGNNGQAPYCIYGPPGTGKTVTIVESIVQVLRVDENKKFLVCASSDAACDVIAKRLLPVLPTSSEVARVNWVSRNPSSLPPILLSCSYIDESGFFYIPSISHIQQASVVICQCFVAGSFELESSVPWMNKHFTHCFIDESSQSFEFESLIPILKVGTNCSIVLSGDPKQLGPSVRSSCASTNGLSLSLQERLMGLAMYQHTSNYCVVTRFYDNYRSHSALLAVPSELFYEGSLRCKASAEITSVCEGFEMLSDGRNFPLLVYDVYEGQERSKIDTPSFYNVEECYAAVRIIQSLLGSPNVHVHAGQIAIITCFRAQVLKMREILGKANLSTVNVGVVEDFQGQESSVVLVSTVLTKNQRRWMKGSLSGLGFMLDPKRFNVAITRASSLCVIVGNVDYLENSGSYWTALIGHVRMKRGISGAAIVQSGLNNDDFSADYDMNAFIQKVEELNLLGAGHEMDRYDLAMRGYYEDSPEWKVCL